MPVVGTPGFQDGVQIPAVSLLDSYHKALAFPWGWGARFRRADSTMISAQPLNSVTGNQLPCLFQVISRLSSVDNCIIEYLPFYEIKAGNVFMWFFGDCVWEIDILSMLGSQFLICLNGFSRICSNSCLPLPPESGINSHGPMMAAWFFHVDCCYLAAIKTDLASWCTPLPAWCKWS